MCANVRSTRYETFSTTRTFQANDKLYLRVLIIRLSVLWEARSLPPHTHPPKAQEQRNEYSPRPPSASIGPKRRRLRAGCAHRRHTPSAQTTTAERKEKLLARRRQTLSARVACAERGVFKWCVREASVRGRRRLQTSCAHRRHAGTRQAHRQRLPNARRNSRRADGSACMQCVHATGGNRAEGRDCG